MKIKNLNTNHLQWILPLLILLSSCGIYGQKIKRSWQFTAGTGFTINKHKLLPFFGSGSSADMHIDQGMDINCAYQIKTKKHLFFDFGFQASLDKMKFTIIKNGIPEGNIRIPVQTGQDELFRGMLYVGVGRDLNINRKKILSIQLNAGASYLLNNGFLGSDFWPYDNEVSLIEGGFSTSKSDLNLILAPRISYSKYIPALKGELVFYVGYSQAAFYLYEGQITSFSGDNRDVFGSSFKLKMYDESFNFGIGYRT